MKITVVALGKIGLPLAVQFARSGHEVIGADVNQQTVATVNEGLAPFPGEAHLDDYLASPCAATALCFEDHHGRSKAMIPNPTLPFMKQHSFATATAVC